MRTITLPVHGMNFATCASGIEKRLGALRGVASVAASYVTQTMTITYDESHLSEATLRDVVADCGYICGEALHAGHAAMEHAPTTTMPTTDHTDHMDHVAMEHGDAASSPEAEMARAAREHAAMGHTPAAAPTPAQVGHAGHAGHEGMAHGEMAASDEMAGMDHGAAHGGMAHDMSDPAMAAAMEADMRRRFWVALVLTLPVILYSPLAVSLFHLRLPTPFGVSPNWVMLVLATPIVWWCGWTFHSGAWRALRNRSLDMNVLVSLGVLVAYLFSAFATLFAPTVETSFDAAAMLVTFVLFGHWMEMRSRRGSSDALNALLRLAPAQANLDRPRWPAARRPRRAGQGERSAAAAPRREGPGGWRGGRRRERAG